MYSKLQLAKKYLQYYAKASNGKGHGVHSPFVFDFITNVLNDNRHYYCFDTIERQRLQLLHNKRTITIDDFGAGSRVESQKQRQIASVAQSSLKPKKFSRLLFRIANYYHPKTVIELGTSFGITTAYMASANPDARIITMEGAKEIAAEAKKGFDALALKNIKLVEGNFDNTLPAELKKLGNVDLAFVDGNHRRQPTIAYFNQLLTKVDENSILIFDDIHWSEEMEQAWNEIQSNEQVTLTIDLFFIGLVFFRKEQKVKQYFTVRF